MTRGILYSGVLHGALVALMLISWQFTDPLPPTESYIPVELLEVSDITNVAPQSPSETPAPDPKPAPEPEPPKPQETAALPPEPEPVPPEPAPKPLEPDTAVEPPPPPEPLPREEPKPREEQQAAVPPKTPRPKPPQRPRPTEQKPAPKPEFDLDQIIGVIDREQQQPRPQQQADQTPAGAERPQRGAGLQTGLTISEKDALLAQMRRCWNPPIGAPRPEELIVRLFIRLRQDGSLDGPPDIVDPGRYSAGDTFYRAAVDAARRAVIQCQPYSLPSDKFEAWREIDMTFDPTRMAGLR